ncbi:hypothetical protein A5893_08900 [Pedobacter psychrophilus]|uniref:Viral A-type inclusion protein n=1 Tax=Pedobacter psychrophilus TaxID=1826909 RepID=A0A179DFW2_9SPHI|nr:hypothetical protein [Pedobacter psychrophilus]OAQ39692.1 hypothetical protein A5893_08900 [Pedobacter psychrophilus]
MPLINIKNSITIILGITIIGFSSCKDQKAEQKKLQTEVMAVHDSLMMDMGKLTDKRMMLTKLSSNLDSLKKANNSLDTAQLKAEIADQKLALTNADDAMMKWMNGFNPDYTGKSSKEIAQYLESQKIKIDSVKTMFNKSLSNSNSLISKLK